MAVAGMDGKSRHGRQWQWWAWRTNDNGDWRKTNDGSQRGLILVTG